MKNNEGFLHIIIIIVGAVIALLYLGFDPVSIWNNAVLPILIALGKIFVVVVDFLITITVKFFGIFKN